jgi:manganese/iron transport system substrate-binding protein
MQINRRFFSIKKITGLFSLGILVSMVGCTQPTETRQGETDPSAGVSELPQVVATTSVLCDLTQQIAQDTVDLTCLMEAGRDPHTYSAKPSDRRAIDEADLVLYDGYNATPELIRMVEASTSPVPKVAVYEVAVPEPLMGEAHDHDHDHDDHDHDHDEDDHDHDHDEETHDDHDHDGDEAELAPDPHIWHNALHNGKMAEVIATNLSAINPDQADFYGNNAEQLSDQFSALDNWIKAQVETVPAANRKLISTHEAFNYFAEAYGFEIAGALSGLSTDEQTSAARLTELVDAVKASGVTSIFAETTSNTKLIETLANEAGVAVAENPLFVEGPGGPGTPAETVQTMLVANTCTVVNALGGTCAEADAPL